MSQHQNHIFKAYLKLICAFSVSLSLFGLFVAVAVAQGIYFYIFKENIRHSLLNSVTICNRIIRRQEHSIVVVRPKLIWSRSFSIWRYTYTRTHQSTMCSGKMLWCFVGNKKVQYRCYYCVHCWRRCWRRWRCLQRWKNVTGKRKRFLSFIRYCTYFSFWFFTA